MILMLVQNKNTIGVILGKSKKYSFVAKKLKCLTICNCAKEIVKAVTIRFILR